jgi:putative ABC transport system permease protein
MQQIAQDLRHAIRALLKHPGYLATALLTLSLGIGFSTATFSVINAVLLRPLPYAHPERLLQLRERNLPSFPEFSVSPGHYLAWRERATTTFEGLAAYGSQSVNLDMGNGEPERVRADRVSANLFPLLGIQPAIGRTFSEEDDRAGAGKVVLLSYGAWERRFGGADVVGQTVRMDREAFTIVGVMPAGFAFPSIDTEMWVPMAMPDRERQTDGSHYLSAIARMKPGVTLEQARADLAAAARWLEQARPDGNNKGWEALAFPMREFAVRNVSAALWVLFGAVSLVLLIACVNVANLLLARGASRQKELAIRAAIGAGRVRLIRQLLVEQLALALTSAVGGVLLAAWLLRALLALIPNALPRQADIALDAQVLLFALLLVVVTPLLFGLFPAVQASRPDLRELLAVGGRDSGAGPGRAVRRALVVTEVALAMVLLVGAGLLMRSFGNLTDESPGFDPAGVIVANVNLPPRYEQGEPRERFFAALLDRVHALPHVRAAGLVQQVPMLGEWVSGYRIAGQPTGGERPTTNFYAVSPRFFESMGMRLLRGRGFTDQDRQGATRVIVINEVLANRHFANQDPIGRRISVGQGTDEYREIVGVVADVKQDGLGEATSAQVYEPYLQHPYLAGMHVLIKSTAADPASIVPEVRAVVRTLDPEVPLSRVRFMEDVVSGSIRPQRFSTVLISLFSAAALLLAAIGVYGVMSYTVGLRTREFAIRVAHGASRSDILRLVLAGAATMAGVGVAVGLVGSYLLRRTIENMLYGVSPHDVPTYLTVGVLLAFVAMVASAVPAFRATRVDPMTALRAE